MRPCRNPAVEDQAADRVHRIGQTRPVTIHRYICKATLEARMLQLQVGPQGRRLEALGVG